MKPSSHGATALETTAQIEKTMDEPDGQRTKVFSLRPICWATRNRPTSSAPSTQTVGQ